VVVAETVAAQFIAPVSRSHEGRAWRNELRRHSSLSGYPVYFLKVHQRAH